MLLVLAVAIVGLGVWAWEPLWWWVMTERTYNDMGLRVDGMPYHLRQWCDRGHWWPATNHWWPATNQYRQACYFAEIGFLAVYIEGGLGYQETTYWLPDGKVNYQLISGTRTKRVDSAPWLWGVSDQTEPTIPAWMKDDAKWQAALDAQE